MFTLSKNLFKSITMICKPVIIKTRIRTMWNGINLVKRSSYRFSNYGLVDVNVCVIISPCTNYKIIIRTMMSGKSIYAARAAYYCAKALTNPDVIDNTTKTNHQPLTKSLVSLSVDDTKGVVQHKTTLIKHGLL